MSMSCDDLGDAAAGNALSVKGIHSLADAASTSTTLELMDESEEPKIWRVLDCHGLL